MTASASTKPTTDLADLRRITAMESEVWDADLSWLAAYAVSSRPPGEHRRSSRRPRARSYPPPGHRAAAALTAGGSWLPSSHSDLEPVLAQHAADRLDPAEAGPDKHQRISRACRRPVEFGREES